jgi:hypothetical protein
MNQQNIDPALIAQIMAMEDPENDPEQIQMARQQKMIEQMRGQTLKGSQGQMVGDRFVAPSAAAQAMNMGTMALGAMNQRGIDKSAMDMSAKRAGTRSGYFQEMIKAMRGQKAPGGMMGPQMPSPYEDQ